MSGKPTAIWLGALLLGTGLPAAATVHHVDKNHPACSDEGRDTAAVPLCSIGAGASRAGPGDTVRVASGIYLERVKVQRSGTEENPIVIEAADEADVVVSGAENGFYVVDASWIVIRGFTVTNTTSYGVYLKDSSHIAVEYNRVTRAGRRKQGETRGGIYLKATTDSEIRGNTTIHNSDAGIYLSQGTTGITVINNVAKYNARAYEQAAPGIDVRTGGNRIVGNISHHNEGSGIQLRSYSSGEPSPDNLVTDNVCYDNGENGIHVLDAPGTRIIGNTVFNNATAGINVEGNSSGATLANNISMDNAVGSSTTLGNIRVDGRSAPDTTLDYNIYFLSRPGITISWRGKKYPSRYAHQKAIKSACCIESLHLMQ